MPDTSTLEADVSSDRGRHHERDARRVPEGARAVAHDREFEALEARSRTRVRKPGTTPGPGMPPSAS